MALCRMWKQLQAVTMGGDNLTDASNQVTIGSKPSARKKRFQLRDKRVELTY